MSSPALDTFSITRQALDPRADGASRTVHLSATLVTIERAVQGVRMRVGVPVSAYRDLVISVQSPNGRATLKLRHADSELDVVIGSGDPMDVARSARAWSSVVGKEVAVEDASVAMNGAYPRQRKRTKPARRSRFARNRQPGVTQRMTTSFASEHEIIARD